MGLMKGEKGATFTEYLSTFLGFELFPCPNPLTPYRLLLREKPIGLGHPAAKNASNIQ
jgi:hypothetical protein